MATQQSNTLALIAPLSLKKNAVNIQIACGTPLTKDVPNLLSIESIQNNKNNQNNFRSHFDQIVCFLFILYLSFY